MNYGLQLYSLNDITKNDLEKALRAASEIGYADIEFAGFFDHSAAEVKGWLDQYHLNPCSTHIHTDLLKNSFDETVAYHKEIGCSNIIFSWIPFETKKDLDSIIDDINQFQKKLQAEGMSLHFHTHYWDYLPNRDGQLAIDELTKKTDILFEIDTYWAFVAGQDPIEVMTRLKDRIRYIHLKDGNGGFGGLSLGRGTAPVEKVRKKAEELGFGMIVESEGCQPDGPSEVKRCFDYLKSVE